MTINWNAVGVISNIILVGALVYINRKQVAIMFKTYEEDRLMRKRDNSLKEMHELVGPLYGNVKNDNRYFPDLDPESTDSFYKDYSTFWTMMQQKRYLSTSQDLIESWNDYDNCKKKYGEMCAKYDMNGLDISKYEVVTSKSRFKRKIVERYEELQKDIHDN